MTSKIISPFRMGNFLPLMNGQDHNILRSNACGIAIPVNFLTVIFSLNQTAENPCLAVFYVWYVLSRYFLSFIGIVLSSHKPIPEKMAVLSLKKWFSCVPLLLFTLILILLLFSLVPSFGQIVKIQTGTSFSRMDFRISRQYTGFMGKERRDPLLFAGLEYYSRKFFSLSSNIGFLRLGGKEPWYVTDNRGNIISNTTATARFDYVSLSSTIDFKYPITQKIYPFVSIGPRIDYLISHTHDPRFSVFDVPGYIKKISYGLSAGAGVRYQLFKVQLGLRGDYLININNLAEFKPVTYLNIHTFLLSATLGYKIQ